MTRKLALAFGSVTTFLFVFTTLFLFSGVLVLTLNRELWVGGGVFSLKMISSYHLDFVCKPPESIQTALLVPAVWTLKCGGW